MSRPLEIADSLDALATELVVIDVKYALPVGAIFAATTDVRELAATPVPPKIIAESIPASYLRAGEKLMQELKDKQHE